MALACRKHTQYHAQSLTQTHARQSIAYEENSKNSQVKFIYLIWNRTFIVFCWFKISLLCVFFYVFLQLYSIGYLFILWVCESLKSTKVVEIHWKKTRFVLYYFKLCFGIKVEIEIFIDCSVQYSLYYRR